MSILMRLDNYGTIPNMVCALLRSNEDRERNTKDQAGAEEALKADSRKNKKKKPLQSEKG
jgi:hypothetical protein